MEFLRGLWIEATVSYAAGGAHSTGETIVAS